ncbi:UNVERIFIED_CONTAM: Trihelix transcription factor GTL2 [Sesamum radiatum]|uniref:Trihelix transcription factor GTL2 n=1 Tax=Sesamum radiatum TaxID=300843 RepID=A0AAW2VJW5_SESRA
MFDGVGSDQFHQFLASRTSSLLPIPLSFAAYDPYASLHSPTLQHQHQQQHHHQHQESPHKKFIHDENPTPTAALIPTSLGLEGERSRSMDHPRPSNCWSNDEVLALLRLRSSMEMWFPDFTWEHVSRKLVELGFRRSAEQCKEKFDEESRNLNNVSYNKNYRIFSELDELYPADDQETAGVSAERISQNMESNPEKEDQEKVMNKSAEANSENVGEAAAAADPCQQSERKPEKSGKKRKRREKFEMFKGFCEGVVNKMMARQEELHNKLIEDIVKRDEEKISREEAWKNQEMDRFKMEIEMRAKEQASSREGQARIIEFLKKFTSDEDQHLADKIEELVKVNYNMTSNSSTSLVTTEITSLAANYDTGKRWPRDEIQALINLRCKLSSNSSSDDSSNIAKAAPLWERISQGMLELGYKRSAKRCKEKWENINKYFRKTKDSNKKRSIDSRTCPYFHQLSCLYSEGTLVAPTSTTLPETHHHHSPEKHSHHSTSP